jgi:CrcB protein
MSRPIEVILAVAVGSAAGGVARLLLSDAVQLRATGTFPFGTLVVNVVGCFALGFITHLVLDTGEFSPSSRALLTTGLCGGFTTFSTFSLETIRLVEEGSTARAAGYAVGSVGLGLVAVWLGIVVARLCLGVLRGAP